MTHLTEEEIAACANGATSEHARTCDRCSAEVRQTEAMRRTVRRESAPPWLTQARNEERAAEAALAGGAFDAADARLRTAGGVRVLLRIATLVIESEPRRALEMVDAADKAIAELPSAGPGSALSLLRASASRTRANALRYLGRFDDAIAALDDAERALEGVLVAAYDRARIDFTRATMLWEKSEQLDRARELTRSAAAGFRDHSDSIRELHARMLEGAIDFLVHNYGAAREVLASVLAAAEQIDDPATLAHANLALAATEQELDDTRAAAEHYAAARALFEHLEMNVEMLRAEWNLGLLSLKTGHNADGRRRLELAAEGFLRHGNASNAALVTLDLVQHLAATGAMDAARAALGRFAGGELPESVRVQMSTIARALSTPAGPDVAISDARRVLRLEARE